MNRYIAHCIWCSAFCSNCSISIRHMLTNNGTYGPKNLRAGKHFNCFKNKMRSIVLWIECHLGKVWCSSCVKYTILERPRNHCSLWCTTICRYVAACSSVLKMSQDGSSLSGHFDVNIHNDFIADQHHGSCNVFSAIFATGIVVFANISNEPPVLRSSTEAKSTLTTMLPPTLSSTDAEIGRYLYLALWRMPSNDVGLLFESVKDQLWNVYSHLICKTY